MKKFILLVALACGMSAHGQTTTVINTAAPPSWPIGSTNVPISLDTAGRVVLSSSSVTASLSNPAEVRAIVYLTIPTPDPKKQVAVLDDKKPKVRQ
jgi:hypothetical protein